MKSKDSISRALSKIKAEHNRKDKGMVPDYSGLRKVLKGIVSVPTGRLTPAKRGAITRAANRVYDAAKGKPDHVQVLGKGKKADAKRAEMVRITGQVKTDKVFFVKPLRGEVPVWRQRKGKPVLVLRQGAGRQGAGEPTGEPTGDPVDRVYIAFDPVAMKTGQPEVMVSAVLDAMQKVEGNAIYMGAGAYIMNAAQGQGGNALFDTGGIVEALSDMFDGAKYDADGLGDFMLGIWDVTDPNLPSEMGLGGEIEAAYGDILSEVLESIQ